MVESLEITKDKPITLTVLRDGQQKTFTLQPVLLEKRYRIGIGTHADEGEDAAVRGSLKPLPWRKQAECSADFGARQENGAAKIR